MPGEYGEAGCERRGGGGVMVGGLLLVLLQATQIQAGQGPSVPEVTCNTNIDCSLSSWTSPLPDCINSTCRCPDGTCPHYTTGYTQYNYYCGLCGSLGSECNTTADCNSHWQCKGNFCECDRGTIYTELCIYSTPVPTSVSSVVLIIILAVLLILQKLIHSRKVLRSFCRCRCFRNSEEEETRVVGHNPQSNNKTAAYTIANTDFMTSSDDPDLEWALELSRQLDQQEAAESTYSTLSSSRTPLDPRFTDDPRRRLNSTSRSFLTQPGPSGWRSERSRANTWSSASSQPCTRRCSRPASLSSLSSFSSVFSQSSGASFASARPSVSLYASFASSPQARFSAQSSSISPTPDTPPSTSTSYPSLSTPAPAASASQNMTSFSPTSASTASISSTGATASIFSFTATSSTSSSVSASPVPSSASSASFSSLTSTSSIRQSTQSCRQVSVSAANTCVSVPMGVDESDIKGTTV